MLNDIRILVVDSAADHRTQIKQSLESALPGCELVFVGSAGEALSAISGASYDCIIIDPHLPGEDGFWLIDALEKKGNSTPVLFVTPQQDDEVAAKAIASAAVGYVPEQSPLLPPVVERTIVRWRARQSAERERDQYRRLAEYSGDFLIRYDIKPGNSIANPALSRITGYTLEELYPFSAFILLVAEEDKTLLLRHYESLVAGKPPDAPFSFRFRRKDGVEIWLECSLAVEYDTDGSLYAVDIVGRDVTASKAEERARLEIEERYRAVFETSSNAMMLVNAETDFILLANKAWYALTGYSAGDVDEGLIWKHLVPPANLERVLQGVEISAVDGRPYYPDKDEEIMCKDGSLRNVILSTQWLLEGKTTLVSLQDITGRLRREGELRAAKDILQAIISASPVGIVDLDKDLNVLSCWNQAAEAMFGWGADEVIGKPLPIIPENKAEEHEALMRSLLGGQPVNDVEIVRKRKDGSLIDVSFSASVIKDQQGNISRILLSFHDITESKRLQNEIKENERRYRLLIDNMAEGMVSIDERENVMFSNTSADMIFGVFPDSLVGHSLRSFVSEEQFAVFREQTELRRQGKSSSFEVEIARPDGGKRILLVTASPQHDASGRFIGTFGPLRDITERKRIEEALRLDESRLEALFQLDQMTGHSEDELFKFAMTEAVRLTQSKIGFIALIDETESKVVMHTWAGRIFVEPDEGVARKQFVVAETGPVGEAVKKRKPIIDNAPAVPGTGRPVPPEGHIGITRKMTVPVLDGEKIVLVAGVGNKDTDYDQSDMRQLSLLVGGLWRIIQRRRALLELNRSEEFNRAIVEHSPIGIIVRSPKGRLLAYNKAWQLIYALSIDEIEDDMRRERSELAFDESDEYLHEWLVQIRDVYEAGGSLYLPEVHTIAQRPGAAEWVSKYFYAIKGGDGNVERVVIMTQDVTYRKHMEDALVSSEERFRAITETALDLIYIKDASLRYVYANATTLKLLGIEESELYGKTYEEVFHSPQAGDSLRADKSVLQGAIAYTSDTLAIGDEIRSYSTIRSPLRGKDGEITGICCISRDVSERERLISELQTSDEQVRSVMDVTSSYIWSAEFLDDGSLAEVATTPGFLRIYGVSSEQIKETDAFVSLYIHKEDLPMVRDSLAALKDGKPASLEYRIVRPDGGIRWLRNEGHAVVGQNGKVLRIEGIATDITGRKQAEEQALTAERRFRELLDSVQLIALGLDSKGKVFYANPFLANMLNTPREALYGVSWIGAFVPGHARSAYKSALSAPEGEFRPHFEGALKLNSGEERLIAWSNTTLRDSGGKAVGLMAIGQDITDAKRAAEELWRASEIRRALASSVMAAQEHERSHIARELHDVLGQLLTGLKMEVDYVRTHSPKGESKERINVASHELDEVMAIVRDLAYGLRPPILDDLGVGPALESLIAETARKSRLKFTINIHARTEAMSPELSTAVYRITQEALTNVVRHSGAKHVNVTLRRTKSYITLSVRDDGKGFNPIIGDSPFSLGIAGMRERTALFSGTFTIESCAGKGTTVTARFPVSPRSKTTEATGK